MIVSVLTDKKTKTLFLTFTALTATVGSSTLLGVAAASYSSGISFGLSFALLSVFGWGLVAWLAPRIKEWGDRIGAYTFSDFITVRFVPSVRTTSVLIIEPVAL